MALSLTMIVTDEVSGIKADYLNTYIDRSRRIRSSRITQ
jgi:hypothetical protein